MVFFAGGPEFEATALLFISGAAWKRCGDFAVSTMSKILVENYFNVFRHCRSVHLHCTFPSDLFE